MYSIHGTVSMSWILLRGCIFVGYCNYIANVNPEKDISVAKTQLINTVETICRGCNTFKFESFKLELKINCSRYHTYYSSYYSTTYFSPLSTILSDKDSKDNELFLTKFKEWVNQCDELYIIYLFLHIFEIKEIKSKR